MGKMNPFLFVIVASMLIACSSVAFSDKYYQLDNVAGKELRGDKPEHDMPISACAPSDIPSGGKAYKCVVHFYADYDALLKRITDLENELRACQQGN